MPGPFWEITRRLDRVEHLLTHLLRIVEHPPRPATRLRARIDERIIAMSTATLTWTLPTTRVDGSPLAATDIASIDIFDSGAAIGNAPGAATTFTTGVLTVGAHGFTVVVNDTTGHQSAPSNVASVTVAPTLAVPSAVTDLAAVLNP
jgi:hypothetical protein